MDRSEKWKNKIWMIINRLNDLNKTIVFYWTNKFSNRFWKKLLFFLWTNDFFEQICGYKIFYFLNCLFFKTTFWTEGTILPNYCFARKRTKYKAELSPLTLEMHYKCSGLALQCTLLKCLDKEFWRIWNEFCSKILPLIKIRTLLLVQNILPEVGNV